MPVTTLCAMRRPIALLTLPAVMLTLAVAGCGAETQSSVGDFEGDEREVAQLVDDLEKAAGDADAEEICGRIFATELLNSIKAGDSDCVEEMEKALADANDFEIEVVDVTVTGSTAKATVRQGEEGRTAEFSFERDGDAWRATSLG